MAFVLTRTQRKVAADLLTYVILIFVGAVILIPVAWMLSTALKRLGDVYLYPPVWIPHPLQWGNFGRALTFLPFGKFFLNTSVITLSSVALQLISSPLIAYAFARLRARGKNFLFIFVISTMMIPWQVSMVPVFILMRTLGWVNTFAPLIVPNLFGSAYFIFLLRQFYATISGQLDDAARIDGCSRLGIFYRILLPLSKPALATVAIFCFMGNWNDFMGPLIYLSSRDKWTLTIGLNGFTGAYGSTAWNLLMAASLVTILPCIALYFSAQRFFIQGIVVTGLKG